MLTQSWREGADGSLSRYHPQGFMGDGKLVPGSQVGGKAWHQGHQNPRVPAVGRDALTHLDSTARQALGTREGCSPPKTYSLFVHSLNRNF